MIAPYEVFYVVTEMNRRTLRLTAYHSTTNPFAARQMNPHPFDPFRDRLSRDIRNDLSASLLDCLHEGTLAPARQIAERYLLAQTGPEYVAYINDRLTRYGQFIAQAANGPDDVLWQGLLLWDLGLFFEVHEILEHAWLHAQGEEKALLQAMIRAAGFYIKGEFGFIEGSHKLAGKALPVLEAHRERLACYCDPERLLTALRERRTQPPLLLT
jgi:hypothetical protein